MRKRKTKKRRKKIRKRRKIKMISIDYL